MSEYDARSEWTKSISTMDFAYPAEYVIRMFKGTYPRLALGAEGYEGKRICDVGCGDGRHMMLLKRLGFDVYGIEITEEILDTIRENMRGAGTSDVTLAVGDNINVPFPDGHFDFLLSWNSCYYMGPNRDFGAHVREYARVMKPGGKLVMSIPKKTCFIYHGSESIGDGLQIIRQDPFGIRNGEVLRMFDGEDDIAESFGADFDDFVFGSDHDDAFGFDYHWHLVVCTRRSS